MEGSLIKRCTCAVHVLCCARRRLHLVGGRGGCWEAFAWVGGVDRWMDVEDTDEVGDTVMVCFEIR